MYLVSLKYKLLKNIKIWTRSALCSPTLCWSFEANIGWILYRLLSTFSTVDHVCRYKCKSCFLMDCEHLAVIKCKVCDNYSRNSTCFEIHNSSFCKKLKKCKKCGGKKNTEIMFVLMKSGVRVVVLLLI